MTREKKRALIGMVGALGAILFVFAVVKAVTSCKERMAAKHEPVETPEPLKATG